MLLILFFVLGDVEMIGKQEKASYINGLDTLREQYKSSYVEDSSVPLERPAGLGVGPNVKRISPEGQIEDIDISMKRLKSLAKRINWRNNTDEFLCSYRKNFCYEAIGMNSWIQPLEIEVLSRDKQFRK